jgi:hypothetical protein
MAGTFGRGQATWIHVWQRSINRRQKVLRMKRVWWNCYIEMDAAAKADLWEDSAGGPRQTKY